MAKLESIARSLPLSRAAAYGTLLIAVAALTSGCETMTPGRSSQSSGSSSTAPAAPYNLTGYSAAFKQGYSDACETPRRSNAARLKSDTDYSMGWNDGQSACRSR